MYKKREETSLFPLFIWKCGQYWKIKVHILKLLTEYTTLKMEAVSLYIKEKTIDKKAFKLEKLPCYSIFTWFDKVGNV
ncbi:hypothetical protein CD32_15490 [Lysinibacillus odysseyi 34hs-1 = NBRC 100172]|uniref:Uncharacterized protein n=1 Tax=Lysinibacillus odysseyi 34hs-1 = NBRC 100172 TaxID=1220589 RepID=A0A0A3IKA9_9BACI|nr:hypothetical protein CD32_15490 [Lysinibacillus odysseyi 34hs-1 = NBRC 100172]